MSDTGHIFGQLMRSQLQETKTYDLRLSNVKKSIADEGKLRDSKTIISHKR